MPRLRRAGRTDPPSTRQPPGRAGPAAHDAAARGVTVATRGGAPARNGAGESARKNPGTGAKLGEVARGGTQNLVGALRTCMGTVGARTIKEMQLTELIIAPAIQHEGKIFQKAQRVGMGK